jgi:acetyl esterase/lipase
LDYSKSPGHIFPTAVHDIIALAHAVIADKSLPIDISRVAIGGFSAGGCLAMAAAQASDLRGKFQAVLGWYPVLDLSTTMTQKLARRSYAYKGQKDSLEDIWGGMEWGYLRDLEDGARKNPLVSPLFARKQDLPPFVYLVGAQWDALSSEVRDMAEKLSGKSIPATTYEMEADYERVRWEEVRNVEHGFTHVKGSNIDKESETQRVLLTQELYCRVGDWLKDGPFAGRV